MRVMAAQPKKKRLRDVEKQRAWWRAWYQRNKKKQMGYNTRRRARIRAAFRQFMVGKKCCRCGEDHPACLDFHHREDEKKRLPGSEARPGGHDGTMRANEYGCW